MRTIKSVLDELLSDVKFDKELGKALYLFRVRYITQSREHMEFFGGNTIGVQTVWFKDSDRNRLLDPLDIDYSELEEATRSAEDIEQRYKVGADPLNLLLMYLIHRWGNEKSIGVKERKERQTDVALIFFIRCLAIRISAWFKYNADPKIAQTAYSNLSKKFLIKELGSWNKVMEYRANALLELKSPHVKTLVDFSPGKAVQYAVADSQGRIKDLVKGYFAELERVRLGGSALKVTSSTQTDEDGEEGLRDKTYSPEVYVHTLRQAVTDPNTFVVEEHLKIVSKTNSNTSVRVVRSVLSWISLNASNPQNHKLIDDFIALVVVQSVYFLNNNIDPSKRKDLVFVMTTVKNLFLSTRSTDPDLLKIRELGEKIITSSEGKLSSSLMMATRTAVIMYICLRVMIGKVGNK